MTRKHRAKWSPARDGMSAAAMQKEQCRCAAFCLEDTARSGRYCKLKSAALRKEGGR